MKSKRIYVGLANSVHDSAMAIVDEDGNVLFAESTERCLQNKRAIGVSPDHFVWTRKVLDTYAKDATQIVLSRSWSDKMNSIVDGQIAKVIESEPIIDKYSSQINDELIYEFFYGKFMAYASRNMLACPGVSFEHELKSRENSTAKVIKNIGWNHHLSHAATACLTSGMESGLCVILDGYGEESAVAVYEYNQNEESWEKMFVYDEDLSYKSTASLGSYYSLICRLCGFDSLKGEEWKVMGLACYGKINPEFYNELRELIWIENGHIIEKEVLKKNKVVEKLTKYKIKEGQDFLEVADIAFTGQKYFEDILLEFLNICYEKHPNKNLLFGGGCALNSKANGLIIKNTPFEKLHIYSAPSDDGNALGAAYLSFLSMGGKKDNLKLLTPYLGSSFEQDKLDKLNKYGWGNIEYVGEKQYELAAKLLSDGKIIGWANGRAEFGPRALGNRSILADPRYSEVKDYLNAHVKFREAFRPFAPSILEEFAEEYFMDAEDSPYMQKTILFNENKYDVVPGVVHFDGTGRVQTVKKEWNPQYYRLIHAFYEITGVPVLLNTSFNVMGKPIIHSVEDAVAVFTTSGIDALFIEGYYLSK